MVCTLELLAWSKVLALGGDALEVISIVLEAAGDLDGCNLSREDEYAPVPRLVGVGEPG